MQRRHRLVFEAACLGIALAILGFSHGASANSIWVTSVTQQCADSPDDTVRVDVMLENNFDPIDGGTLYVTVQDYHVFPLVAVERGELVSGWAQFNGHQEPAGGGVVIELSNGTPIPPGTSGQLVRLKYLSNCCTSGELYSSPYAAKISVQGGGDFGSPMAWVDGTFICAPTWDGLLYVENGITTCDGPSPIARVRVWVENTAVPIDAAGFDVDIWQGASMTYLGYERGNLTADWDSLVVTGNPYGRVFVDGANSAPIPAGTTGTLVTLIFQTNCCTVGPLGYGEGHVTLEPQLLRGDLASFKMEAGRWYCAPVATKPSTWGYVKSLYR